MPKFLRIFKKYFFSFSLPRLNICFAKDLRKIISSLTTYNTALCVFAKDLGAKGKNIFLTTTAVEIRQTSKQEQKIFACSWRAGKWDGCGGNVHGDVVKLLTNRTPNWNLSSARFVKQKKMSNSIFVRSELSCGKKRFLKLQVL